MRLRNLFVCIAVVIVALCSASPSRAQGETRFGVWDNSTNPNNVMTYEPYEKGDPFIQRFVDLEDAAGVRRASGDEEGAKLFDALRKLAETVALEGWYYGRK